MLVYRLLVNDEIVKMIFLHWFASETGFYINVCL